MRRRRWVIGIVGCALVAAACSGGADSTAASDPEASDPAAPGASTTTVTAPEQPPPDLAALGFVDNLLAKEADGEWTRAEGLVATLQLALGEIDADQVLRHSDTVDVEMTGIVAMARDHVEAAPGDAAAEEIARLLDRLVFSNERLEAMAGIGPETASIEHGIAMGALQTAEQDCLDFFPEQKDTVAGGIGACLQVREVVVLDAAGDGPYRIFVPAPELGTGGWAEKHYQLAAEAMAESIPVLSELQALNPPFEMPPVNLVFSVNEGIAPALADPKAGRQCGVGVFTELLEPIYTELDFKQIIAHELGHCFQAERFPDQNSLPYEYFRWREEGMAQLLSNLVYPKNDLEWDPGRLDRLAENELQTSLFDRAYTNSIFFQHVISTQGIDVLFDLISELPTQPGHQAQKDAMVAYPGNLETHQEYAETLTDEMIEDSGGAFGKYPMRDTNFPKIEVTSPGTIVTAVLEPFQLTRRHIVVPPGKQACLTWDDADLHVRKRDHPKAPGDPTWEELPVLLPPALDESGDIALAVTSRKPTTFSLRVSSVHDLNEEHDGELAGEWVVVNSSMRPKVEYIAPVQEVSSIGGQIRVTFRTDGTLRLVYDNFTVSGSSDVFLERGAFRTDYSETWMSVTDAAGEDTYELAATGDYVFYGELFEENILEGTETVRTIASGLFLGIESGDYELDVEIPETTEEEYPASGWAFIGAANEVRFACGGEILLLDDIVLRRAG